MLTYLAGEVLCRVGLCRSQMLSEEDLRCDFPKCSEIHFYWIQLILVPYRGTKDPCGQLMCFYFLLKTCGPMQ